MTPEQRAFLETCTDKDVDEACNHIRILREFEKKLTERINDLKKEIQTPQIKVLEEDIEIE